MDLVRLRICHEQIVLSIERKSISKKSTDKSESNAGWRKFVDLVKSQLTTVQISGVGWEFANKGCRDKRSDQKRESDD